MAGNIEGVNQITAEELQQLMKENQNIKFVDVREPYEYEAGHIPGVPLVPMNTIPAKMAELDPDDEYVFICRSGARSHHVSKFLQENGFAKVSNFNGGMLSWRGEIKQGMEE